MSEVYIWKSEQWISRMKKDYGNEHKDMYHKIGAIIIILERCLELLENKKKQYHYNT